MVRHSVTLTQRASLGSDDQYRTRGQRFHSLGRRGPDCPFIRAFYRGAVDIDPAGVEGHARPRRRPGDGSLPGGRHQCEMGRRTVPSGARPHRRGAGARHPIQCRRNRKPDPRRHRDAAWQCEVLCGGRRRAHAVFHRSQRQADRRARPRIFFGVGERPVLVFLAAARQSVEWRANLRGQQAADARRTIRRRGDHLLRCDASQGDLGVAGPRRYLDCQPYPQ